MLQTAYHSVARIMQIARSLNGVISGEHGIGITKMEFLSDEDMQPFWDYKAKVDPEGRFNRHKLMKGADLRNAYTPSFELLGAESLIMEKSSLGTIAESVKDCLRCGKCKPVCSTHVPRANLLYSPRNKILGVGLLTEAFLYEEQTRRGVSLKHFDELTNIGDHCTVCHRCVKPCPVNIDFGDVTVAIRNYLNETGHSTTVPAAAMGMAFLNATNPKAIKALRGAMIQTGFPAQNFAYKLGKMFPIVKKEKAAPAATAHYWALKTTRASQSSATRKLPMTAKPCSTSQAAVPSVCSAKSVWPPKRCCGMSACKPCCHQAICVAAIRKMRAAIKHAPSR